MFARFTDDARAVVVRAQHEARELGHDYIGCEHLLLGLWAAPDGGAARALERHGARLGELREAVRAVVGPCLDRPDPDALRSLGIDLDEVRRRVEQAFGEGALERTRAMGRRRCGAVPFTPRAKRVLELALKEALALGHRHVASEHILLGLLREGESVGVAVLAHAGVTPAALRAAVLAELDRAA